MDLFARYPDERPKFEHMASTRMARVNAVLDRSAREKRLEAFLEGRQNDT